MALRSETDNPELIEEFLASYHEASEETVKEVMALLTCTEGAVDWTTATCLMSRQDIVKLAEVLKKRHGGGKDDRAGKLPPGMTQEMLRGDGFGDGMGYEQEGGA